MRRQPWSKKSGSRRAKNGRHSPSSLKLEALENRQLLAADLVSLVPTDGDTGVGLDANLVLTFSDPVKAGPGAGRLLILNAADDTLVEAIDVSDPARVNFNGATVTVDPVNPLPAKADLYVTIDPGAIRDASSTKGDAVLFSENFETAHLLDSKLDKPVLNDYALFLTGTLDVPADGKFVFGIANDDGGYLAIDLNGDGVANINDAEDTVIFDDTTHGVVDFFSEGSITLAKGQYKFEYMYFERGGGSGGEFFYAKDDGTLADPIVFDAEKFAVVGDATKGIGVVGDIKATLYKAVAGTQVGNIQTALDLRDGNIDVEEGYPKDKVVTTADIWDSGGLGHYPANNLLPGIDPVDPDPRDYNNVLPTGWTKETNKPQPQKEYDGWTLLNYDLWLAEQGGQAREDWVLQDGTVLVMDPDAFDDFSTINDGVEPEHDLEAYATLPVIDLTDVTANSIKLDFDSSFRPESQSNTNDEHEDWIGQTGLIDVSFDGGTTWENVLVKNSITEGGDGSREHTNEHLTVDIPNPSGGTLHIRYGIVNSQNNWWWGVDNIVIKGEVVGDTYAGIVNDRTVWNFTTGEGGGGIDGDFNGDGKVDLTDFGILKGNFGKTPATEAEGDANGDAKVDLTDFGILKDNFGKSGSVATPAVVAQATDYVFAVGVAQAAKSATDVDPFADDTL